MAFYVRIKNPNLIRKYPSLWIAEDSGGGANHLVENSLDYVVSTIVPITCYVSENTLHDSNTVACALRV